MLNKYLLARHSIWTSVLTASSNDSIAFLNLVVNPLYI